MRTQRDGRWLLLGASGLVGTHLQVALAGRDVVMTSHRRPLPGAVVLDVTDHAAVTRVVSDTRPDVVIVTVTEHTERCERDPDATRLVNVDGLQRVAERAPGALLVVFSSEYVFDGRTGPYSEEDAVAPINEYGRQKVAVESVARRRPDHLICRTSGIYGWSTARENFVCKLVDSLRAGRRFTVPMDQVITPTPAPDLAQAVVELVDRGARGTFHVAGPEILSRPEFARRVAAAFGLDASLIDAVPTSELGLLAPRPLGAGLRTDKLRGFFGHGLSPSAAALAAMREGEPVS
jgi:dTDP-4-dehydrorhamnose reductase